MFQQNIHWPEVKSHQAAEGLETSEDHQQDPQAEGRLGNTIGSTVDLFPHMAVNLICQIRWLISYARSDG